MTSLSGSLEEDLKSNFTLNNEDMRRIEKAVEAYMNTEDLDEGNALIRKAVTNLSELRFAIAVARQLPNMEEETEDMIEALIEA